MLGTAGGGILDPPVPSPFMVDRRRKEVEILNAGHPDTLNSQRETQHGEDP